MNLKNVGKVLKFTLSQQLKAKSFKVSTTIILLLVFIMTSLVNIIPATKSKSSSNNGSNTEQTTKLSIKNVYLKDDSNLNLKLLETCKTSFPNVNFSKSDTTKESMIEKFKTTKESEIFILITKIENTYNLEIITPSDKKLVKDEDINTLSSAISSQINYGKYISEGIDPNKIQKLDAPINTKIIAAGEKEKNLETIIAQTILPMLACILLFYMIYFYGYWVANSIVAEKTSRVMELLLTSTKPLALIVGKCLAMGILAITQFFSIILTSIIAFKVSAVFSKNVINSNAKIFDINVLLGNISALDYFWIILLFILGYVFYSILNALAGATVSKLEDLNMSIMPITFIGMIGFYLSYAAIFAPSPVIKKLAAYLPFSSAFYIPSAILGGKSSLSETLISLLILIVSIILLVIFTARVYSVAILHNGNRLKIKDLFSIFKEEK